MLASDLFVLLFTPDEMALGNLTGKRPNGHKDYMPKEKLDEGRINGIVGKIKF